MASSSTSTSTSTSTSSGKIADWTWLLKDLLDSIFNKITSPYDQLRFSAICKRWQSVAVDYYYKPRQRQSRPNQLPLLMIPNEGFYSIDDRTTHSFGIQLPAPYRTKRCCGSSHGWLAFAEKDLAVTLINPFTSATISLPPLKKVPAYEDFNPDYEIKKLILSTDPSLNPDGSFEAVAIHGGMRRLAFIKAGDETWTLLFKNSPVLDDVIYYRGGVHAVNRWGKVISVDTAKKPRRKLLAKKKKKVCSNHAYLVELSGGDLLMIRRFFREDDEEEKEGVTSRFEVHKLVVSEGRVKKALKRVEVEDLGGDAVFLGDNHTMSVVASEFPGCCCPNSIYFTDDFDFEPYEPHDMGVFNLVDKSFGMHYTPNPSPKINVLPPIWIVPKFNLTSGNVVGTQKSTKTDSPGRPL